MTCLLLPFSKGNRVEHYIIEGFEGHRDIDDLVVTWEKRLNKFSESSHTVIVMHVLFSVTEL